MKKLKSSRFEGILKDKYQIRSYVYKAYALELVNLIMYPQPIYVKYDK